jgi:hypothetical protein
METMTIENALQALRMGGVGLVELLGQALGIVGMVINILSMQCRKTSGVLTMLLIGGCFFTANYFLLGSYAGALMNVYSVFRSLYLLVDKRVRKPSQLVVLMSVLAVCGAVGLYYDGLIALLPLVAHIAANIGMWLRNGAKLRLLQLMIVSPLWLINNVIVFTIGGILCEIFVITSVLVSIWRYGWKALMASD